MYLVTHSTVMDTDPVYEEHVIVKDPGMALGVMNCNVAL
jgi:hypothetical protein